MNLNSLPINAFDGALIVMLLLGLFTGRKHGMSQELLSLIPWLLVVLGCAFIYQPVGQWLAQSSPFSLLASYMVVYTVGAAIILGIFGLLRYQFGGKLMGSDFFGRSEYYLGMGSGLVRFACIVVAFMAVLNARYFSPREVTDMQKFQDDVYGANYFPTWHTAQEVVFEKSLTGPWIKDNLGFLLIQPTKPENKQYHQKDAVLP